MNKKNLCAVCGGILIEEDIRYDKRWEDKIAIFENVPAQVCPQCGETWIDGKILEKMEKLFHKKMRPTYKLMIPVWSLKKAAFSR
jgi:YgiT-type zinc finger domain-containing protein